MVWPCYSAETTQCNPRYSCFFIWYGFAAADKLQHILGQQKVCLRTKNDMRTQNSVGNRLGQSRQAELYCQTNEDKYIWGLTENLLCSPVREFSITGPRVDLRSLFWTQAGSFNLWYLAGTPVCRRAFLQMLGVSCQRLSRTRGHFRGLDERTLKGQKSNTRAATATASVSVFMQKMYFSVSESMPTGFLI